eukprot:1179993-Prorocentrum_minimum.AAC.2
MVIIQADGLACDASRAKGELERWVWMLRAIVWTLRETVWMLRAIVCSRESGGCGARPRRYWHRRTRKTK